MRALDDILFGFLIFFAIDRLIRLVSNGVIEPWAKKMTKSENVIENWKLVAELVLLLMALTVVYYFRKNIERFAT